MKAFGAFAGELLAHDAIQVLGAEHDLPDRHLTLAEPTEDGRSVIERLGARELFDRLGALAGVGELNALNSE